MTRNDTDPNCPYLKWRRGEITEVEYQNEIAQEKGFKDRNEEVHTRLKERGFKNTTEYKDYLAQQRGFKNHKELRDFRARKKGYKDNLDYVIQTRRKRNVLRGLPESMEKNKECSLWLGVGIAEKVLSKVFNNVQRMSCNNPGYDFICGKGYKIDVKSSCLSNKNKWSFTIRNNTIADYFLLLAFDNREDLNPLHIWLIKSIEKIKKHRLCDVIEGIKITNKPEYLKDYKPFELSDKLEQVVSCCNTLKST